MNIFRFLADLSHLASIFILLHKMQTSRSCRGISFKSQALYLTVFVTRYLDLFTSYVSIYNTTMKLFFIGSSAYVLYLMKYKYRPTQDPSLDTFNIWYIVGPAALLGLIFNIKFTFIEITWSFSIWLESVAILPQLFMLQRTGEAETITTHYIAALGLYRALYIPNWIYRYFTEGAFDPIAVTAGIIQTAIYADFGYIFRAAWCAILNKLRPIRGDGEGEVEQRKPTPWLWSWMWPIMWHKWDLHPEDDEVDDVEAQGALALPESPEPSPVLAASRAQPTETTPLLPEELPRSYTEPSDGVVLSSRGSSPPAEGQQRQERYRDDPEPSQEGSGEQQTDPAARRRESTSSSQSQSETHAQSETQTPNQAEAQDLYVTKVLRGEKFELPA